MTPRRPRRTQAERSAETREALVNAAIDLLHRKGYAATTTILIAELAGVSRGAMLHHFNAKVDLMVEVVRSVYEEELERYDQLITPIKGADARRRAMPEIVWQVLSRPSGVAVLEILQGSRSDPVLAERLAPIQTQIEQDAIRQLRSYGVQTDRETMRLVVWAIRGLSIAQILAPDPSAIPASVELLRDLLDQRSKAGSATGAAASAASATTADTN